MPASERVVSIVTGPLIGLDSHALLDATKEFGASLGKKLEVFGLIEELAELDDREISNPIDRFLYIRELLEGYDYQFELKRKHAYCSIGRKIDALPAGTHAIVRAPAAVEFRGVTIEFKDHRTIARAIAPRRIVTLIDAEWKIRDRLEKQYEGRAFELIAQAPSLDLERVLRWLGTEVSTSEDWAEWCRQLNERPVGHIVMGVSAPSKHNRAKFAPDADNLLKAATEQDLPTFYASYSMTVAKEPQRRLINNAVWRLREHALVIDPGTIELGAEVHDEQRVVFASTVFRDLRWDVKKVDAVAAFHPYEKGLPPLSTGMLDELGHARAYGKDSYFVLPKGGGSPFTAGNYVPENHVFKTADELFAFIEKKRRPPIKRRFTEQVRAFERYTRKFAA